MYWQWSSRQGNERQSNNDAVAVINGKTFFFVMLVDAAEKSDKSKQFSCYWAETIARSVLKLKAKPSNNEVLNILRNAQKQLRHEFLHETASYIALIYDKNTQKGQALVCGDCRLGLVSGGIKWLTKTHTLETAFDESLGGVTKGAMTRHTLTHSLNAKRFSNPKMVELDAIKDEYWILCSDGYWLEHVDEKIPWQALNDDASCLTTAVNKLPSEQINSDCENCFSYNL